MIQLLASGSRARWVSHLLRDAGRDLSPARNADSALETFAALRLRRRLEPPVYEQVRACLAADCIAIDLRPLRTRVLAAREEIARWPAADPARFDHVMRRGSRSARKAMVRAIDSGDAADLHDWRKRAKRQWYQAVHLEQHERASLLQKLSRALGRHHDLSLLQDAIARHADVLDAAACSVVFEAASRRSAALEDDIIAVGTALFSATAGSSPAAPETQPTSDSSR